MNIKRTVLVVSMVFGGVLVGISLIVFIAREQFPPPNINFSSSPNQVLLGKDVTLRWSVKGADSCIASGGWEGKRDRSSGRERLKASETEQVYVLACVGPGGESEKIVKVTAI